MTTDPTPTADEQVMAALAKMTGGVDGEWKYIGDGQIECPDPEQPDFPWLIAETVPDDDAAGIVTLKNLAPVLAADYLREKARADAAEAENARLRQHIADEANRFNIVGSDWERAQQALDALVSGVKTRARAALAQKGTQHG